MKTYVKFVIILWFIPVSVFAKFSFWGNTPKNNISVGAFTWHIQDTFSSASHSDPHYALYPYIGVTYDSVNLLYFKNTYQRSTVGVAVQREIYNKDISKNFALNVNYRLGALFAGYCIKSLSCEPPSARVIPIGILTGGISYKDRAGFSVSVFGVVIFATFQYYF